MSVPAPKLMIPIFMATATKSMVSVFDGAVYIYENIGIFRHIWKRAFWLSFVGSLFLEPLSLRKEERN